MIQFTLIDSRVLSQSSIIVVSRGSHLRIHGEFVCGIKSQTASGLASSFVCARQRNCVACNDCNLPRRDIFHRIVSLANFFERDGNFPCEFFFRWWSEIVDWAERDIAFYFRNKQIVAEPAKRVRRLLAVIADVNVSTAVKSREITSCTGSKISILYIFFALLSPFFTIYELGMAIRDQSSAQ